MDAEWRNGSTNPFREFPAEAVQSLWFFGLTLPNHHRVPAEFAQGPLMQLVAGGVAVEFGQPPLAPVRGRGAVPTTAMPMPETAVDKYRNLVLGQDDVGSDESRSSTPHLFPMTRSRPLARPVVGLRLRRIPFVASQATQVPGRGGEDNRDADVQAKAVTHSAQQGPNDFFWRCMFATNTRHVPRTTSFSQAVPIHDGNLTAKNAKNTEKRNINRSKRRRFSNFVPFVSFCGNGLAGFAISAFFVVK